MKKLINSAFFILFLSVVVSCSSDDSTPVDSNIPTENTFTFKVDGQEKTVAQWQAQRVEHILVVNGVTNDGYSVQIIFNKSGNIGQVIVTSEEFFMRLNHAYDRAAHFNFDMTSLNEENNTVSASFSGKVYDEEMDLTTDFYEVEGNFNLAYTESQPQFPGVGLFATVNGQPWMDTGTNSVSVLGIGFERFIYNNFNSDNEYIIAPVVKTTSVVGSYTFDETSSYNKVAVFKYNPELGYEEELVSTSGNLELTEATSLGFGYYLVAGTFNVTAEHPETGEVVTVTNGSFKTVYQY